jgi:hypothetical protein
LFNKTLFQKLGKLISLFAHPNESIVGHALYTLIYILFKIDEDINDNPVEQKVYKQYIFIYILVRIKPKR